jgi:hypothetical protein
MVIDAAQLVLEVSPERQARGWAQSQSASSPTTRWQIYLNQICLDACLAWLHEEGHRQASPWPQQHATALASIWEVVNGTAIAVDGQRWVLLPTEAIDAEELRVPQEWVDSPEWAADYYISVQVNPDEGWVRLGGYCSHLQLKERGHYDAGDRTYCVTDDEWIPAIETLWVTRHLCPEEETRAPIAPLPTLTLEQAETLLQRLGDPALTLPRLAVPFERGGALLAHAGWRQRLAERRRGLPEQRSILDWLQSGVSGLAQQVGWSVITYQPSGVGARSATTASPSLAFAHPLAIAGQPYQLQVMPLDPANPRIWRFELRSLSVGGSIPAGVTLRLLTEDLQPFPDNTCRSTADVDCLYIEVELEPGEGLVWEVEPTPADYEREILRF